MGNTPINRTPILLSSHNYYNMSKSRVPLALGLGAAGGIGYYLYAAGGNAKAAENKFESDMHKVSANVESYAKDAKAEALKGIDKFDQKVEEGSAKAKGWFGESKRFSSQTKLSRDDTCRSWSFNGSL